MAIPERRQLTKGVAADFVPPSATLTCTVCARHEAAEPQDVSRWKPMTKQKRKLTRAEKKAKARRKAEFMIIFVNGKQKSVRRPGLIEGLEADEFIRRNADPIWLHQNEMWEYMPEVAVEEEAAEDGQVPF